MFLAFSITDIITVPFGMVLNALYRLTSSYGMAIILFSACVSLLLHPVRMKNAVNGAKKARLQPKVLAIRKMFPGDTKVQTKIMEEMYLQEGVSPSMGCLTSILPILILFPLYAVVRQPVVNMLGESRETVAGIFELMQELAPALFGEAGTYNEMIVAQNIPNFINEIRAAFPEVGERVLEGINFNFLGLNLAQVPELDSAKWEAVDWAHIGLVVLPFLAAACHVLPSLIKSLTRSLLLKRPILGPLTAREAKRGLISLLLLCCWSLRWLASRSLRR